MHVRPLRSRAYPTSNFLIILKDLNVYFLQPFRPPTTAPRTPAPQTAAPVVRAVTRPTPTTTSTRRPFVDCFNRNPCCESWAKQGECSSNRAYMNTYCRAACKFCNPAYNSTNGKF